MVEWIWVTVSIDRRMTRRCACPDLAQLQLLGLRQAGYPWGMPLSIGAVIRMRGPRHLFMTMQRSGEFLSRIASLRQGIASLVATTASKVVSE
jgi:hypothetical protein